MKKEMKKNHSLTGEPFTTAKSEREGDRKSEKGIRLHMQR